MIYFLCLFVIPTKNLLFSYLFNSIHFLKFDSSINLYFFASPHNERSTYINDFTLACISKSSHSRAACFNFIFYFLIDSPLSSLLFQEDILDFLMRMSIPSLPDCIYQFDSFSYTYVFQYLPLHLCFLFFI